MASTLVQVPVTAGLDTCPTLDPDTQRPEGTCEHQSGHVPPPAEAKSRPPYAHQTLNRLPSLLLPSYGVLLLPLADSFLPSPICEHLKFLSVNLGDLASVPPPVQ